MNKFFIALMTFVILAIQVFLTFKINIGWILILSLVAMGFFIITNYKSLALSTVFAVFLYGGVIAMLDHEQYVSQEIKLSQNVVIDQKSGTRFIISMNDWKKYKNRLKKEQKELLCQSYTLLHKVLPDTFCYLRVGKKDLIKVEKLRS
ncbi:MULTISPECIES: hypothetical protein [unclassified Nitratiruptor]|uniref:hypothetical protein n=1 Tax=unclassified Nitratiruptor TaxID=2624044 RepID=UPI0019166FF3|nr:MULTISPECIES: hypothetical protein [unclassified Nitratiruptor]BCD60435.1 hypothetical protein NitYY0810_C1200 [Nitratiruptor sp. YY08-10]BCD64076.1 hypothetical protein NitYY0814_C0921 [Nitratiruptor sp. YY08-14]